MSAGLNDTDDSTEPSATPMPTSSPAAVAMLKGKWRNPESTDPYYYYFMDETYLYMHVKDAETDTVRLRYRATGETLYIMSDTEEEEGSVVLLQYNYVLKGSTLEITDYEEIDHKVLTKTE